MSSAWSVIQTLFVPALISFALFLFVSYAAVPLWQNYRSRYGRYLPLETISAHTATIRQRVQHTLTTYLLPSSWRDRFHSSQHIGTGDGVSEDGFDDDDGEELYEVDENRREALSLDARRGQEHGGHRLSRDIEEGFRDDSEEESETNTQHGQAHAR